MRNPNFQEPELKRRWRRMNILREPEPQRRWRRMNILREEKKLWRKGFKRVAGLDEAGRGPLAGPVVAAAVIIQSTLGHSPTGEAKYKIQNTRIRDSKQLSAKQRDIFFQLITKNKNIKWGIGRVSEKVIDKINILEATKLAMIKAVKNLETEFPFMEAKVKMKGVKKSFSSFVSSSTRRSKSSSPFKNQNHKSKLKVDFLVLDGNFTLPAEALAKAGINPLISQKSIIKGDEKVFSVAAASILAKVARDRIMVCCHKKYPQYRFDIHKGYPTKYHCKMIRKYGPCKIHRKTFAPLKRFS